MSSERQDVSRLELLGYSDRPSAAPGEKMSFMVSCELPEYEAVIVRLVHGDQNLAGPGFKEEVLKSSVVGTYVGSRQETQMGSYVRVSSSPALVNLSSFTVQLWMRASKPVSALSQGLVSHMSDDGNGFCLGIDPTGRVYLQVGLAGRVEQLVLDQVLRSDVWYFVAAGCDSQSGVMRIEISGTPSWPLEDCSRTAERTVSPAGAPNCVADLLIAVASQRQIKQGKFSTGGHFNGRIERPRLFSRLLAASEIGQLREGSDALSVGSIVADWDLGIEPSSNRVHDVSGNALDGLAINFPTRALLGRSWDRNTFKYLDAPEMFGSIEFHEDDNEDCNWDVSIEFAIPVDLKSGVYALRLRAGNTEDHIPFFVRPPRDSATSSICYLIPTMTYLAYANESILATSPDADWTAMTEIEVVPDPYDKYVWSHRELAYSIYDTHTDGSGINYSSWHRPILNMRPKHRFWVTSAPRHFAADLYLTDWLEEKGHSYDVVTDHDLHAEGIGLLSRYKVIITGSHPEYWTEPMLNALEAYMAGGGKLIYLGGNGFYWVTGVDPDRPHIIEVRRGYANTRTWTSHPAELNLASTGETGGIWRFRGRSPNSLVGVGFAAQGWSKSSPGFERLPDSYDPRVAFIFKGLGDELIGDFGLVLNGASGDEIDRFDNGLGTPTHALRLATTQGRQSKYYLITHEDLLVTTKDVDGTTNPDVRCDITYFETGNGGAVFSLPAISASGSLSYNNYDNNVSKIINNVLERFMR